MWIEHPGETERYARQLDMKRSPAAAATAVLYNGRSADMLVAYADALTGRLHTLQFEEGRADSREAERLLEFHWDRTAPAGASIVIPEAGHPLSKLDEYWLLWRCEDGLAGQSTRRESPLVSPVGEGEWMIDRPLVAGNRELHVYAWREGLLVRHRYADVVTVDTVLELSARPSRSICAPVPGDDGDTDFIGFVTQADGGILATAVYARGKQAMHVEGRAEGRYRLMGRQRMGAHVGRKGRPAIAVMAENHDDGSYGLLEARFDFEKNECVWKRTKFETIPAGDLVSASVFYYKTQDAPEPFIAAVNQAGQLLLPRRRNVIVVRDGVGAGYGYPILTTMTSRYEAAGAGSELVLRKL